jgi:UDP-N-acetylmuramoyl-L-alanyl-D-glutamate--2,6-diaminopimelate ligase
MWQDAKNQYNLFQAILALLLYRFPAKGMKIIGVTGTDGKTTTSSLIYHCLQQAGKRAALISTAGAFIDGESSDTGLHITTPGRFALQSYLQKAKQKKVDYVVLELTSHALHQYRSFGIPILVGVLTNISNEHLDYHKTYARYVKAKVSLLKRASIAIVNKDDKSYKHVMPYLKKKIVITYGFKKDSDVNPHMFSFRTKLIGRFNEYNALAAITALRTIQIPDEDIRKGIASFKAPAGRQEIVYNKNFMVINDFAHTPNSFASILPEIRKVTKNKLIHVFGAAALRDTYKRPEMGKISSDYADVIIITAEDPRKEPLDQISDAIEKGIKYRTKNGQKVPEVYRINNRKEAIEKAVSMAKKGDTILLTGKGHEKSMNYGNGEEPWDESKVTLEAIKKI